MKKRFLLTLAILVAGFPLLVGLRVFDALAAPEKDDSGYANIGLLARTIQLIRQDYVDEKKTGYDELTHAALKGMLGSLDPHSQFMEQRDFKGMQDDTNSRFGGLGIVVAVREGILTIVNPMEDTPGARAGLLPGDQIIKINGQATAKCDINESIEGVRGATRQRR